MSQITSPQYRKAFILVTTLFFMWGLSYGLIDVLNKHFQVTLNVSKAQSGLIQAAYFGAYFVVAIPAGLFMEWKGYKAGILCGLSLYAIGALLFVPAAGVASFTFFLFALFVIALIAVFFFISIMFPTIFAMGTKNLGTRKKLGGSYMIMAIVGGAIMPYFMGLIADYTHTAAAFLLPLCCFVCVVLYGAAYGRLVKE